MIASEEIKEKILQEEEPLQQENEGPSMQEGQNQQDQQVKEFRERFTHQFEQFKRNFDEQVHSEAKLQAAVDFMENSLSHGGGTPHFRSFWEARRLCLPLFKDNEVSPGLRAVLWSKYSELSKEARRLKEILDEQSAFAVEQIELAIQALEQEIANIDKLNDKDPFQDISSIPHFIKDHLKSYTDLQKQLNLLNALASRINGLRKELLKTEMRVKHKNKFFQQLSVAGDHVFPRRKELIKQMSQLFSDDVAFFIKKYFESEDVKETFYVLRDEIKGFQGLAKVLTLNTQAFTQTRMRLSECWDRIKVEEKERKKERLHQKQTFKENADEIKKQIDSLKESFEKNEETQSGTQKKIEAIASHMRKVDLGRDEVKSLKDALYDLRQLMNEKVKAGEEIKLQEELERNRLKKEKYHSLKKEIETLFQTYDQKDADQLIEERDQLLNQINLLQKNEKQELERLLKPLRDLITDKKESALLALSEDDRQSLQQMKTILNQRKERRQEIKNQLEVLRKGAGSSSLDFEKAMSVNQQINEEKNRLDKANQAIEEIERQIRALQAKIKGA